MAERERQGAQKSEKAATVVVRRSKHHDDHGGHHGGAWKIAYADFVTAMMAFFLLMWLLGSTSKFEKQGIEDYFNTPLSSMLGGKDGNGAARSSVIQGGGRELADSRPGEGSQSQTQPAATKPVPAASATSDATRLEQIKSKLTALINTNVTLREFKDQIRVSIVNEGLRIEIVDTLKRPMFATGSYRLEDYALAILTQVGASLNDVDNRISIAGHTDAMPYSQGPAGYSNWELSAERANAARRALVTGGMHADKVLQVRGLADVLPLDHDVVDAPTNRRISILVLNKAAEDAFFHDSNRSELSGGVPAGGLPVGNGS
ncbi:flagellar motor protein MotB [Paraburkholderia jirisanensis]